MNFLRQYQLQAMALHFIRLGFADSGLQCDKMFLFDPGSFGQDLPPSILAGGFGTEDS
jgi:hypothetical protein